MGQFFYSLLLIVTILGKTDASCGIRKTTSFNSMEHEASSGEFPWQVLLKPDSGLSCLGTIIGEFWILSSAQCFTEMTTKILLRAGKLNGDSEGTVYPIRKLIRYADYNGKTSDNTLALLETSEPIIFNAMVLPACFPDDDLLDVNQLVNCWATTLKETPQDGSYIDTSVLQKIQCIPIEPCDFDNMTDIICATASDPDSSDCTLNSGDTLMCQYELNKAWTVVGTAAIENTECNTTMVFTRTASYITWLKESTEMEGKPVIPEINAAELPEPISKTEHRVNNSLYYNEEFPSTDYEGDEGLRNISNHESKLEAGKMMALSSFYIHVFLVILAI